jgi:hypothetical protein
MADVHENLSTSQWPVFGVESGLGWRLRIALLQQLDRMQVRRRTNAMLRRAAGG